MAPDPQLKNHGDRLKQLEDEARNTEKKLTDHDKILAKTEAALGKAEANGGKIEANFVTLFAVAAALDIKIAKVDLALFDASRTVRRLITEGDGRLAQKIEKFLQWKQRFNPDFVTSPEQRFVRAHQATVQSIAHYDAANDLQQRAVNPTLRAAYRDQIQEHLRQAEKYKKKADDLARKVDRELRGQVELNIELVEQLQHDLVILGSRLAAIS
ncbi:MAG TPA: hypothetical protein VHJ17_15560 [Thermomonospora sp.]|nr:hypothetical protein [Thermomonospora sp.]